MSQKWVHQLRVCNYEIGLPNNRICKSENKILTCTIFLVLVSGFY